MELQTGLEYWFSRRMPGSRMQRHSSSFSSHSANFPPTILVPWALQPLMAAIPVLANFWMAKLLVAVAIVWLMVYVIIPRYTRVVAGWLFKE